MREPKFVDQMKFTILETHRGSYITCKDLCGSTSDGDSTFKKVLRVFVCLCDILQL